VEAASNAAMEMVLDGIVGVAENPSAADLEKKRSEDQTSAQAREFGPWPTIYEVDLFRCSLPNRAGDGIKIQYELRSGLERRYLQGSS
jgi:hypothetical protein